MAILYRIYGNNGTGGPVDFSSPIATVQELSYATGPLNASGDYTFLVRAYDPGTGFEDGNTEARVRVSIGPDGSDMSGVPGPPTALSFIPLGGGGAGLSWVYW